MVGSSSSSSSGLGWKYDVFINFRGEDTRRGFVSHLYRALRQKPLNTFIDTEDLRKGDRLSELLTAIRESRLSIVVFSQNYASSTWCLKELVEILECKDTKNQIVVPIFYEVDPSDIRKLKGSFAEALPKHERCHSNVDVQSWRSALARTIDLSGWDSSKYNKKSSFFKHKDCEQHLIGNFKFLSRKLRCLILNGFPLKSLPSNCQFKNLVDLDMQSSLIDRLWEGTQTLEKLKFINLSYCQYLEETPDFTKMPNLEKLILQSCRRLVGVHPSIWTHTNLVLLNLKGCKELKSLSSSIHMKSLQSLDLSGCSSLEIFPEIPEVMEELSWLSFSGVHMGELCNICQSVYLLLLFMVQCEPPRDVEDYIHRSGRTGRAGNSGVAVMLYDPRRSNFSKIERESGVKFEHISVPQPLDIAKAVGQDAAEMITKISDGVIPAFKSVAEELVNTSGLSAVDLLAKALAKAAGYTEIKKRSLLSSMEDHVTVLIEAGKPIYSPSFAFGVLRRFLPEEKVESVKGMALTADGNGAVFDVASEDLDLFLAGQENAANVSITVLKSLPDLQEKESRNTRFGGGGRFGRGGGGGFRNDRYSNNRSGGGGGGGGGRGRGNRW
ncbi:DEAD-box ATP-dependent RNA helicase 7-like [Pyrus ussuriensis x Pyrus communis]|uniref:DEAD-box ATP-dependent RNA helicase 7 n=1 Tax=Pyrus ussuriensis x Pyrus communis TaxID=2448454 RepID=A0A5N5F0D7_9ROSA|nr:DEAD-box ATP-dependent RNA helicase 7-like [Pyrus ussuriensis x Pyrus communis]